MMVTFLNSEQMRSFIPSKRGLVNASVVKEESIRKSSTEECTGRSAMKPGQSWPPERWNQNGTNVQEF